MLSITKKTLGTLLAVPIVAITTVVAIDSISWENGVDVSEAKSKTKISDEKSYLDPIPSRVQVAREFQEDGSIDETSFSACASSSQDRLNASSSSAKSSIASDVEMVVAAALINRIVNIEDLAEVLVGSLNLLKDQGEVGEAHGIKTIKCCHKNVSLYAQSYFDAGMQLQRFDLKIELCLLSELFLSSKTDAAIKWQSAISKNQEITNVASITAYPAKIGPEIMSTLATITPPLLFGASLVEVDDRWAANSLVLSVDLRDQRQLLVHTVIPFADSDVSNRVKVEQSVGSGSKVDRLLVSLFPRDK